MNTIRIRIIENWVDGYSDKEPSYNIQYCTSSTWKTLMSVPTATEGILPIKSKSPHELRNLLCKRLGYSEIIFDEYPMKKLYKFKTY